MMDIFRRQHCPIDDEAWQAIESVVRETLTTRMTARRVVDVDGPHGLSFAALNLGRLGETHEHNGVNYALRQVQPLMELRVPFELSQWELDNIARGAPDADLDPAVRAALTLVDFEERTVYSGLEAAGIHGLSSADAHERIPLASSPAKTPASVAQAVQRLVSAGVSGPYALVLPHDRYTALTTDTSTYPLHKQVAALLYGGPLLRATSLDGHGFLVSLRGGDLSLTLGQDVAIGYDAHDAQHVKLYLTESFTFNILGAEAVVAFTDA